MAGRYLRASTQYGVEAMSYWIKRVPANSPSFGGIVRGGRTTDPTRDSLRLFPSGPDRVGEGTVQRLPPFGRITSPSRLVYGEGSLTSLNETFSQSYLSGLMRLSATSS